MEPNTNSPQPNQPTPPITVPPPAKGIQPLRTYAHDMSEAMVEQQGSVVRIALAEQKRKDEIKAITSPVSKRNLTFMITSIVSLVLAAGVFGYFFFSHKNDVVVVPKQTTYSSIIFSDSYLTLDATSLLTAKQFIDAMAGQLQSVTLDASKLADLVITTTAPTTHILTTEELLTKMEADASPDLVRSFAPIYMVGTYTGTATAPFALLQTGSYDTALAGMLVWERKLFDNFYSLFGISIEGAHTDLFQKTFEDSIIQNHDARILRDDTGTIVMLYTFLNNKTILITTNLETVKEILTRLNTPKN